MEVFSREKRNEVHRSKTEHMCGWEENRWREKHLELLAYAENGHTSLLELEWTVHEAWDSCRIASLPWHTYCMCSKWLEKNWNAKPGISVQSLYMKLKKTNRHYIQSCQPQNHDRIFTHWYYQLVWKGRTFHKCQLSGQTLKTSLSQIARSTRGQTTGDPNIHS